jgi:membrane associated rhomboid family serine protease
MDVKQIRFLAETAIFGLALYLARVPSTVPSLLERFKLLVFLVTFTWLLFVFNAVFLGNTLTRFGVQPRRFSNLLYLPVPVFLHQGEDHLLGNTEGFLLFGGRLMLFKGISDFLMVSLIVMAISCFGIWLFGRKNSVHFGASGMVLGYFGFLLLRGYFEWDLLSTLLSLLMMAFYSKTFFQLLPRDGVSWLGHFFGFMGGCLAAVYLDPIRASLSSAN